MGKFAVSQVSGLFVGISFVERVISQYPPQMVTAFCGSFKHFFEGLAHVEPARSLHRER